MENVSVISRGEKTLTLYTIKFFR